ncbi:MAG: 3-dehydroquinate synthase [Deltaproteobacteria bacterium]|nr:3-dehydroquinate synthase [Deltaproteobacteria bacterium]
MKKICVRPPSKKPYNAYIAHKEILQNLGSLIEKHTSSKKLILLFSTHLDKFYADRILKSLASHFEIQKIEIQDVEKNKSFAQVQELIEKLTALRPDRSTPLVYVGGGVLGDLCGFVASIYLRGLPYFAIPTSLISQVDSSVGGKCGINLPQGKNLVGTFHHPEAVFIDVSFLKTLPQTLVQSSFSEVIKYAIIGSPRLWNMLHAHKTKLLEQRDHKLFTTLVFECLTVKKKFIEHDEYDFSERRSLNLGHTFGHALETFGQGNSDVSHGEAVAQGLYFALHLSLKHKLCQHKTHQKIKTLLEHYGFCEKPYDEGLLKGFAFDKKRNGKELNWVLIQDIGKVKSHSLGLDS